MTSLPRIRHLVAVGTATAAVVLTISGQAAVLNAARHVHAAAQPPVRFAGYTGEPPTYFFPMYTGASWDIGYLPLFSYVLWRPLSIFGKGGKPIFNEQQSLMLPPLFGHAANGHTTASITLKPWNWSDGRPITTRDVEFWMNLLAQEKTNFAPYVPGKFPDNVTSIHYLSAKRFVITFNANYNTGWLLGNELSQITPIPQHAWDKTSSSGAVGNYDRTPAGARKVYAFLQRQAKTVSTFATNPLWKVVDGAWEISQFSPATGYAAMKPNLNFSGSPKPRISSFVTVPFTSEASEFDALEAGQLDYGFVPVNDLSTIPSLKAKGYRIVAWPEDGWGGVLFNYAKYDAATPILKQLYIRQALAHLTDIPTILNKIEHGLGYYASGPVPDPGYNNPLVTSYERHDPYPYSIAAARRLLTEHGWNLVSSGTSSCKRPGTGPTDCGAGIKMGAKLDFNYLYTSGSVVNSETTQLLRSSYSRVGVTLNIRSAPAGAVTAAESSCIDATRCSWDINLGFRFWPLGWPGWYPGAASPFGCHSSGNYFNWCDAETQRLIQAYHTSPGNSGLFAFENYIAKEQPVIFLPIMPYQISAIRRGLQGVTPQDPYQDIYPNLWYWSNS